MDQFYQNHSESEDYLNVADTRFPGPAPSGEGQEGLQVGETNVLANKTKGCSQASPQIWLVSCVVRPSSIASGLMFVPCLTTSTKNLIHRLQMKLKVLSLTSG
jgi:hypothetical protein